MEMRNDERGTMNDERRSRFSVIHRSSFIVLTFLLVGCSDSKPTTQPSTIRDRQDAALKDPFGYSVDVNKEHSVSGGGLFELDKDGFKKDMDHALNP